MLEKCTELGADQITLVNYQRTVRLAKSNALKRFRKTMISAAKQSLTPFLPRITGPFTLTQSMDHLKKHYTNAQFFYGSSSGKYCSESQLDKNKDYIIFIGPEGGFTQNEVDLLRINNISAVSLAQNTLRIETAVIAFASLIANFRQRNKINAG
jgi:16S rRNA (uracil1498-N3)-methyltransferase